MMENRWIKRIVFLLVLTIPLLFFLNIRQTFQFREIEGEVVDLERQQKEMYEENKRMVIGIEFLRSPERIDSLAQDVLELKPLESDKVLRIIVTGGAK
ncbi:MAG: cell division protein FtsL [Spirochaetales bacterium]|nr:cell division protein FtsL [Spirochaetales bacterium]